MAKSSMSLEERIATTEADVRSLATEVGQIHNVVNQLTNTVQKGFEDLRNKQTENIRTDWNVIWAAAAVTLAMFGIVGSGYFRDYSRLESSINRLSELQIQHEKQGGHPRLEEIVRHQGVRQEKLDEVLQREMRILDSAMEKDIESLDIRLQREMELIKEQLETEIHSNRF